ncbi:uncharacterized protein LOC105170697 [Sesamum indicum]|uniref:Cysteine proteinase inhibitor n=1 Tax=Sesamum indicum TaxID=4182 RepID=A0A6I9TXQ6_SESIN|nr:uncharacterized protein LOC105170697 [Sesamum indicum]
MDNLIFDQKAYSEYMDDLNYSQGFYVTPGRDGSVLVGRIRRVGEYSGDLYRKAEQAARFAVEEHNKEEGEKGLLKFLRIVNLNVEPAAAAVYYITMAAADSAGETCHYQAKVWEKINTGYKLQIFRLAPYWLKFSDKLANNFCCIRIDKLMPWMNESYIYYKCFYRAHKELLGVEVVHNEQRGSGRGVLWFKTWAEAESVVNKYAGKMMPSTNMFYEFDLNISP